MTQARRDRETTRRSQRTDICRRAHALRLVRTRVILLGLACGLLVALCANLFAVGPLGEGVQVASAHALLVRSQPTANQILNAPPSQVQMWFSEALNTASSRAVVVDTTNRVVEPQSARVNRGNANEMDVTLPLLKAGTYVVAWRTQSAIDGHIVGGSFIFRVASPDGTVPAVPKVLPTGNIPGGGGTAASGGTSLDGPTALQSLGTWLAELLLAFWLGGLLWETWILPPGLPRDRDLAAAAAAAGRRFARLARWALVGVLVADVLIVLGQSAELAGDWTGAFDPTLLHAVLFGSRFGTFWWARQAVALVALVYGVVLPRVSRTGWAASRTTMRESISEQHAADATNQASSDSVSPTGWQHEVFVVLRVLPRLPARLVRDWRRRSLFARIDVLLGLALLVAFSLSGHAAAVPASEFGYAVSVDLLHLLCTAIWVGGLLYISAVLVPAMHTLDARTRARVFALGLPEFSALAIVSVVVLAATGTLNSTIHLTSLSQVVTTAYGRTLFVKSELFLVMVAISAYHAFVLRPRLAAALHEPQSATLAAEIDSRQVAVAGAARARPTPPADATTPALPASPASAHNQHTARGERLSRPAMHLMERIEDWLRREALLGVAILVCVALLSAFAGTLATSASGGAAASTSAHGTPFSDTQTVANTHIALRVAPATFGTNTFAVTLTGGTGQPITGASVLLETTMLDMDMGTQSVQLKAVSGTKGVYSGQSELTMAGHWRAVAKVLLPGSKMFSVATYQFTASY